MSKLEVDKIDPQSGTNLELGTSGDTVTIPTGVTLDASNATTTLPDGTVTNAKVNASAAIDYSKLNLTGNIALADLSATGTKDATTFLRGDNTFAAPSGGKILQVVQTVKNDVFSSASASFVDVTGMSVAITPSSSSNKVLIITNFSTSHSAANSLGVKLVRDTTDIFIADDSDGGLRKYVTSWRYGGGAARAVTQSFQYVDSPSTTSATTYKLQIWATGGTAYLNRMGVDSNNTTYGRSASSIIAMEVAG